MPLALFGITNSALNLAVSLLIFFLVVVWLSLVYWTFADARRRLSDPVLIGTGTLASLLIPFLGTVIYSILRPPEFLDDARERELEVQASELRLRHLAAQSCPRCEHPIERSWLRCPECQQRLKDPCRSCSRPVDPRWSICPYCETPMSSGSRRRGPRSEADGNEPPSRGRKSADELAPERRTKSRGERKPAAAGRAERQERQERGSSTREPRSGSGSGNESEAAPQSQRPARRRSTTTS